ncbi:MAG: hypothetical protein ABGW97_03045 [Christiangramia sp.]|uniref:hypothetical protein n=1 Tax=Christiangramia sp. TaxID=1931228 RepID=UPI003242165A
MTPEAAYQFLEPSLEGFSQRQRNKLARLIAGEPEPEKRKLIDPVPSEAEYRKKLEKWFRTRNK